MADPCPFDELIRRARRGEPEAAAELVERFGPHIRRIARFELRDARMRRLVDSEDVWQSVAGAFFVRLASGDFELRTPGDVFALLSTMARNRARLHHERERAARRDIRRTERLESSADVAIARDRTPSSAAASREILALFRQRLGDEALRIAELRAEGVGWEEIAAATGEASDTLRKRLRRACEKAVRDLGMEEGARE